MKARFLFALIVIFLACSDNKVDTSKIQEEMKAREIQVVPEARIVERTFFLGDSLLTIVNALDTLVLDENPHTSWQLTKDAKVECNLYLASGTYQLTGKEKAVFEAYQYSAENNQSADPNVQKLENGLMLYSAPFMEDGKVRGMWSVKVPRKYVILSIPE